MLDELIIDRKSNRSISQQISQFVRRKIQKKELMPGDKFPSTQEITEQLGVGPHTVRQAMSSLENEGLVKSRPRIGTIVSDGSLEQTSQAIGPVSNNGQRVVRIAAASFINKVNFAVFKEYPVKVDSLTGVIRECENINADLSILPTSISDLDGEQLLQKLRNSQMQGLVWIRPVGDEWDKIEYLQSKKFPVVVTRRSHYESDIISVESDYDGAGFTAANHFIDRGVKKVLLFAYVKSDFTQTGRSPVSSRIPYGLEDGLQRTLDACSDGKIDLEVCGLNAFMPEAKMNNELIMENVGKSDKNCGVIFSGPQPFYNFMKKSNLKAVELLSDRPLIVLSSSDPNAKLAQYVRDIDFHILFDPMEDIGRLAVQKLCNVISGHVASSATLVKLNLRSFWGNGTL